MIIDTGYTFYAMTKDNLIYKMRYYEANHHNGYIVWKLELMTGLINNVWESFTKFDEEVQTINLTQYLRYDSLFQVLEKSKMTRIAECDLAKYMKEVIEKNSESNDLVRVMELRNARS